jgi:hypothetical protein
MAEPQTNGSVDPVNGKPGLEPIQTTGGAYPGVPKTYSPNEPPSAINNAFDEIIPHPDDVHHRNLVLCFDGTGDQFDADVGTYRLDATAIT